MLRRAPGVKSVDRDWKVRKLTTHTPKFLGLPTRVWPTGDGFDRAGEEIVIGFVDSGISPNHPSFQNKNAKPYGPLPKYRGKCEVDPATKKSFCNGKIVGAQHFAAAATAAGVFNPSIDFASPMDGDGHGRYVQSFQYSKLTYFCSNQEKSYTLTFEVKLINLVVLYDSNTAAIAAGNKGIPVQVQGYEFGKASGMAPRAR